MNISSLIKLASLALLFFTFAGFTQAQDAEPIGLMLSTSGEVTAEDKDGNVRQLQRRSPVYEGDTLITADLARAQIRFNDRGLIALQPNTSFFIEEHKYEGQEDGTESAVYSLLRGGLTAITGSIGNSNKDSYEVSTPLASVGLRGTHWAATFCTTSCDGNPPGLYGGVADGGIDVCNGAGCTAVDSNTYFYTPDANTLTETLIAPPSVVFAASDDAEAPEEDQADSDEDSEDNDNAQTADSDENDNGGDTAEAEGTETAQTEVEEQAAETEADTVDDLATFVERSTSVLESTDEIAAIDDILDDIADQVTGESEQERDEANPNESVTSINNEDEEQDVLDIVTEIVVDGESIDLADEGLRIGRDENGGVVVVDENDEVVVVVDEGELTETDPMVSNVNGVASVSTTALQDGEFAPTGTTQIIENNGIGLAVVDDANNALVDFSSLEGGEGAVLAINEGTLEEYSETNGFIAANNILDENGVLSASDDFLVSLGRWSALDSSLTLNGNPVDISQNIHFGYSATPTDLDFLAANPFSLVAPVATYSLIDATAPTDESGNLGSVEKVTLEIDLFQQLITDFSISLFVDNAQFDANLVESVALSDNSDLRLSGYCFGGDCGSETSIIGTSSISLLGQTGEAVLGNYGLATFSDEFPVDEDLLFSNTTVNGVFVLGRDFIGENTDNLPLVRPTESTLAAFSFILREDNFLMPLSVIAIDNTVDDVELGLIDSEIDEGFYVGDISVLGSYRNAFIDSETGNSTLEFLRIPEGQLVELGSTLGGISLFDSSFSDFGGIGGTTSTGSTDIDPLFIVDWGIWDSQSYQSNFSSITDSAGTPTRFLPYVISSDLTIELPDNPITGGSGSIARYQYLGGPSVVSFDSNNGFVEDIFLAFDFMTSSIVDYYISVRDPNFNRYELFLDEHVLLTETTHTLTLIGVCELCDSGTNDVTASGNSFFTFLGENAEGAAGSFSIVSDVSAIAGAYVLQQNDHFVSLPDISSAPDGAVAAFSTIGVDEVTEEVDGLSFGFHIDRDNTAGLTQVDSFNASHPNAIAGISATVDNCIECEWEVTGGELDNYGNTNTPPYDYLPEAYWGRWATEDSLDREDATLALTEFQHFAYSPDASNYDDAVWIGSNTATYSYVAGSTPTDNLGNQGHIQNIDMELDFGTQSINEFDIGVSVGNFDYDMGLDAPTALDANAPFADLALIGTSTDFSNSMEYSAEGSSSVFFIGADADAAIGTFDLNTMGVEHSVNGAFILEQDLLTTPVN